MGLVWLPLAWAFLLPEIPVTPAKLLEQVVAASRENGRRAVNWLAREDIKRYDLRRKRRLMSWLTFEASKVEGENYYRLVGRNGKPLSNEEARREQLKLDREAAYRKSTPPGKRNRSIERRFSLSIPQIIQHHSLQYSGEDTIGGRKIWIIDTRLQDDAPVPTTRDEMALSGNATLWIDQETKLVCMQEVRMTRAWENWYPGSYVRYEMFWNGEVMLVKRIQSRVDGVHQENDQTYTDYRKFGSEANLKFEPSDAMPPAAQ